MGYRRYFISNFGGWWFTGNNTELFNLVTKVPYSGILVDLNTKLRAPEDELDLVKDVIVNFPVAELRCDNNTGKVGVFYQGQSKEGGSLLDFVFSCFSLFLSSITCIYFCLILHAVLLGYF